MTRRVIPAVICTALVVGGLAQPARSAAAATIELRVAKTQAAIDPFGFVEPARSNRNVIVKLFVDTGSGSELRRRKVVDLRGSNYGLEHSVFDTRFDRPSEGECRVVAIFVHRSGSRTTDEQTFSCAVPQFGTGEASIVGDHEPVAVDLLIAESSEQQSYGLSFRRHLAAKRGMAFLFGSDTSASFWMKDTLIPLSIAFFDSNNVIVDIQDMDPCFDDSCPTFGPGQSYRGALEVNQGAFATWGVDVGDTIVITRD